MAVLQMLDVPTGTPALCALPCALVSAPALKVKGRMELDALGPLTHQPAQLVVETCGERMHLIAAQMADLHKFLSLTEEVIAKLPAEAPPAQAPMPVPQQEASPGAASGAAPAAGPTPPNGSAPVAPPTTPAPVAPAATGPASDTAPEGPLEPVAPPTTDAGLPTPPSK